MSGTIFAGLLLVLATFLATTVALILYVRHWERRQQTQARPQALYLEGEYFKRYIPPSLRQGYDCERAAATVVHTMPTRRLGSVLITIIVLASASILGSSLYAFRDNLLPPIDLTPAEIDSLSFNQHHWAPLVDLGLPNLSSLLPLLKRDGFILVSAVGDDDLRHDGVRITEQSAEHWRNFFVHHDLPFSECVLEQLDRCRRTRRNAMLIVLPGRWDFTPIERLLSQGANVILYGAPIQVLKHEVDHLKWQNLTFEPADIQEPRPLALRGDQALTLGFDAGLILGAYPPFGGYRVTTPNPQAIAIGIDRFVGGVIDTRLFALRLKEGRLVWMDFAPQYDDHAASINADHLEAVVAAIFRYLLRQTYASVANWPGGRPFAGFIEEDTEDQFAQAEPVAELAERNGFPITWFVLSNQAQKQRALTRRLAAVGEIACHGDSHLPFSQNDLETQLLRLARCRKVVKALTGRDVVGFRPPEERFNADTLDAVANTGMRYFFAESGTDRAVPKLFREAHGLTTLVSLPRAVSDDYGMWAKGTLNLKDSLALVDSEIAWMEKLGGLYAFSFHSQFMGDAAHVKVIEHIGRTLQGSGAYFATVGEIANWWRLRVELMAGRSVDQDQRERYRPMRLRVTTQGELIQEPF